MQNERIVRRPPQAGDERKVVVFDAEGNRHFKLPVDAAELVAQGGRYGTEEDFRPDAPGNKTFIHTEANNHD